MPNTYFADYARERRKILQTQGLCTRCGCRSAIPNRSKCQICLVYGKVLATKKNELRRQKGQCTRCSNPIDTGRSAWHCQICLDKMKIKYHNGRSACREVQM